MTWRPPTTPPPHEPLGGSLRAVLSAESTRDLHRFVRLVRPALLALAAIGEAMVPVAAHIHRQETSCIE